MMIDEEITIDEAIQELKSDIEWSKLNKYPYIGQRKVKALNIAIKALEQQPCEDCISRQAVLDMQYRIDDSATLSTRDVVNVDDIEDLPSVTPQPKIGHWIDIDEGFSPYKCSECEMIEFKKSEYCPNCGAKMQEVGE